MTGSTSGIKRWSDAEDEEFPLMPLNLNLSSGYTLYDLIFQTKTKTKQKTILQPTATLVLLLLFVSLCTYRHSSCFDFEIFLTWESFKLSSPSCLVDMELDKPTCQATEVHVSDKHFPFFVQSETDMQ